MKYFLIILSLSFAFNGIGQSLPDSGFTNKAEAKNVLVNGLKAGKWIEFVDWEYRSTSDTNSPFYKLTIYKTGKPFGTEMGYYRNGELHWKYPYINGKMDGISLFYFKKGKLERTDHYTQGELNGESKIYYINGNLSGDYFYKNGKEDGMWKEYNQNGKLRKEINYTNEEDWQVKYYDENGNEIK